MSRVKARPAPDLQGVREQVEQAAGTNNVLVFNCKLVTPMYGGGVKAGVVDTAMPIRATAIRGQLRHWWRLLNRNNPDGSRRTPKQLFEAERAIWGGLGDEKTLAKSKIVVQVDTKPAMGLQAAGKMVARRSGKLGFEYDKTLGQAAYALFPAAPNDKKPGIGELLPAGHSFTLRVHLGEGMLQSSDAQWQQVVEAIRWWAAFGGVGARTRRGCGAVEVTDSGRRMLTVSSKEVESQGYKLICGSAQNDAISAWSSAVNTLRNFRQGVDQGRNPPATRDGNKSPAGRSRWPEPDAIRRLTEQSSSQHSEPVCDVGDKFPRAAFGLPILFHFIGGGEPSDTTLKPRPGDGGITAERMASPLILRPYFNGQGWCPALLQLDTSHLEKMGLSLEGKQRKLPKAFSALQWPAGSNADAISPMKGHKDAITAFLAYFAAKTATGNTARSASTGAPRSNHAQGVAGAQLRRNNQNGALTAKHVKTNWYATGVKAEKLFLALPENKRQELINGRYIMVDIEVAGHDILVIREPA